MKILQVCLKPPYPKADGGCIAMAAITEGLLAENQNVKVLCMSTHKHPFQREKVPTDILAKTKMEAIEIDTQIMPIDAFLNLFSTKSYNIQRFDNANFRAKLVSVLSSESFDVIHLESIFCAPYIDSIRQNSNAKVVLRTHNVEHQIWQGLAEQESNAIKRWYLNLLSSRLKTFELNVLNEVDALVPITSEDDSEFKNLDVSTKAQIVPIGVDTTSIEFNEVYSDSIHLYHLGAMDWAPNIEGIEWFLDKIWPKIEQEFPSIKCYLAGRKMPKHLIERTNGNLHVQGRVDSLEEFNKDKNVAVIPLLSGSGMRVKILEALALGKIVITTTLGATGIPFQEGKNILIADTPEQFVDKIRFLKDNPDRLVSIGKEARKLVENEFDLKQVTSKLTYFYSNL